MTSVDKSFWNNKRVFLTGHTGFKGAWLSQWLISMGAKVRGYSIGFPTSPSLFKMLELERQMDHRIGDILNLEALSLSLSEFNPEVVIHMAAQSLVRESYKTPVETYATNVMGTVHIMEAVRGCESVRSLVVVTTDKCYENKEWVWGYRENEAMGGYDPYSSSKGCAELVTSAYRRSFFNPTEYGARHRVGIASARAGNVIGGGDWARDRLIPDIVAAIGANTPVTIRSPHAVRPWQHVLEPLSGYLVLAQALYTNGRDFSDAWNFGPNDSDAKPVEWIVKTLCDMWPGNKGYTIDTDPQPHEAHYLKLDCSKARQALGWKPRWDLHTALGHIVEWSQTYFVKGDIKKTTLEQIKVYEETA